MRLAIFIVFFLLLSPTLFAEEAEQEEAPNTLYLPLQPQFTVNLLGNKHYLRVSIQLELADEKTKESIQANNPAIRHALIVLLSNNNVEDISDFTGKEKLRKKAVVELNNILKKYTQTDGIIDVFFTDFVSQ